MKNRNLSGLVKRDVLLNKYREMNKPKIYGAMVFLLPFLSLFILVIFFNYKSSIAILLFSMIYLSVLFSILLHRQEKKMEIIFRLIELDDCHLTEVGIASDKNNQSLQ